MKERFIHELSDVQSTQIGEGTSIWQYVVILKNAVVGKNCNINCHCFIENDVVVGNDVTIKSGVFLWDGIRIEDKVFIGPNATFVNNPLPRSKQYPERHIGAIVREGTSLGANCTIMGNIEIGKYAVIGAGSVVTKNIPPYTLWYGNPAVHKGYITEDGKKVNMNLKDEEGNVYTYENNILKPQNRIQI